MIEKGVVAISRGPVVTERLASIAEVVGSTSAEFTQFLTQERARWGHQ
jgi:hypothetical protein